VSTTVGDKQVSGGREPGPTENAKRKPSFGKGGKTSVSPPKQKKKRRNKAPPNKAGGGGGASTETATLHADQRKGLRKDQTRFLVETSSSVKKKKATMKRVGVHLPLFHI